MQDIDKISGFIVDGISAVLNWFDKLISAEPGLWIFLSSFITMILLTRFLIVPLMGNMNLGSDVAGTGLIRSKSDSAQPRSRNVQSRSRKKKEKE